MHLGSIDAAFDPSDLQRYNGPYTFLYLCPTPLHYVHLSSVAGAVYCREPHENRSMKAHLNACRLVTDVGMAFYASSVALYGLEYYLGRPLGYLIFSLVALIRDPTN